MKGFAMVSWSYIREKISFNITSEIPNIQAETFQQY